MPYGGVLEDNKLPHVPGTVLLDQLYAQSEAVTGRLKHSTGRNANIVLAPQPSEDPNDPLNWPSWKKNLAYGTTVWGTILYACTAVPLLNAGMLIVATEFNVTFTDMTKISGEQILVLGCIAPAISAISRKWGKRAMLVGSSIILIIGTAVCQSAQDFPTLRAGRIVQGVGVAAYESLSLVMIGDLYFVHERGYYSALINFILTAVSNLSSVVCGVITEKLGWRYLFHILQALTVMQTVMQILFVPETTYNRDRRYDLDNTTNDDLKVLADIEGRAEHVEKNVDTTTTVEPLTMVPAKKTFWQELSLFNGSFTDESIIQLLIAPFAVCLNLPVLYIVLLQGWTVALYVSIAYVLAQIFGLPPYNLSASVIGYLSVGPFLGGLIGGVVFGAINDPVIKSMARRNKGIYEPEYRLILCIAGLFIGAGLFAFGHQAQIGGSFYGTSALHGLIMFGIIASGISTVSYALDAFRSMSSEIFIMGMCVKNFLFYGFCKFALACSLPLLATLVLFETTPFSNLPVN